MGGKYKMSDMTAVVSQSLETVLFRKVKSSQGEEVVIISH